MGDVRGTPYSGVDNLEVMAEAVNYNRFLHRLVASMAREGDRVVDFGAGSGTFAVPMAKVGHRVLCVEPDPGLRERLARRGLPAVADLAEVADASADYLYSLNVLEHIEDDVGALRAIHRALRPGGRLLVYVPAFQVLYSSMDRKVGHYRRYRRSELAEKAEQVGLSVLRTIYVDALGFPASLVYRATDPGDGRINVHALRAYDRLVFPASRLLDRVTGQLFGKNLLLLGSKPRECPVEKDTSKA